MSDPSPLVTAPHDPKGRLISIFVGAVLLPSLALSYVSIEFVPQLARANRDMGVKRAENTLADVEKDLVRAVRARALEAAQAVGTDRLLDGRESVIAAALREAGIDDALFQTLHLEGASSPRRRAARERENEASPPSPRDVLWGLEPAAPGHEDAVEWIDAGGKVAGVLRFRFRPEYVRERIVPDYFSNDFPNPDHALVVRVTDEEGRKVFENAPTPPEGRFEVSRDVESSPSLDGLRLSLRYRDLSIEQDVRRWE